MKSPVFDFKSIKRILDRQEQKAEFEEKNPPGPSMYGTTSPMVAVTFREGGDWIPIEQVQEGELAHAIKFADGSVWDEVNGLRTVKI
jgi:hypothetical protein